MARIGLSGHFRCVFANDNDPYKSATYRANFGDDHLIEGDIAGLDVSKIPTADLSWASFPCQDVSLAGSRGGMAQARSGTFWSFYNIMAELKANARAPKIIVIENVTGLLTSNGGADFAALVTALGNLDLRVGGLIIDAAEFIPQSRPRLFLVAWTPGYTFPEPRMGSSEHPLLQKAVSSLPIEALGVWQSISGTAGKVLNSNLDNVIDEDLPDSVW